jgi:HAD superfamily hydrolase (TIGR01450 family)
MSLVDSYDTVLFDLDGVIYRGPRALPGVPEIIADVEARGVRCVYVTNNASRTPAAVAAHLRDLGIPCTDEQVVTSPQAAVQILAGVCAEGAPIFVVGGTGIEDALRDAGFVPTRNPGDGPVAVVQGFAPDVGWRDLAMASYLIESGCLWVATNLDLTFPTEHGVAPGNGSLVAAVANAVGRQPDHVAGKPEPALLQTAMNRVGAHRALMVGDRLDTDIAGAHRVGIDSLYVATGVHSLIDVCAAGPRSRPTFLGSDLGALVQAPATEVSVVDGTWETDERIPPERAWDVAAALARECWRVQDESGAIDVSDVVERWSRRFPGALPHAAISTVGH